MKVLSVVGDTPGWAYISEIFHEMLPASTREAIRPVSYTHLTLPTIA